MMLRLVVLLFFLQLQALAFADESVSKAESKIENTRLLMEKNQGEIVPSKFPDFLKLNNKDENEGMGFGLRVIEGLALCIGTFLILFHFLKGGKLKKGDRAVRRVQVIERVPLTSKSSLFLVEVDGKKSLISVGTENTAFISLARGARNDFEIFQEQDGDKELNIICREELKRTA